MSGIAEVLINQGYEVTGSDLSRSTVTDHLVQIGARISFGHSSKNVQDAQVVVASNAINRANEEVVTAKENMIPVIPRAEMLAELMRMKQGIAIAGTHGKTTTTSLVGALLAGGKLDPTVVIGGKLKNIGGHAKLGQSEILVAEADESDGSFLHLSPTWAVVTTLDEEHMDHYKTLDKMKEAFLSFINRIPFYGSAILCLDDVNIQSLLPKIEKRVITYGMSSQADYYARNISIEDMKTRFTVYYRGKELGEILSGTLGQHNVCNALAAIAVALEMDVDFNTISESLSSFTGVQRRFEISHLSNSAIWVDDYGHHPAEIKATLKAAKDVWPDKILTVVFQPHRYSRTHFLMQDFWSAFSDADRLIVMDIYAAGENPIEGVDARRVAEGIRNFGHKCVEHIESADQVVLRLAELIAPGEVVMTLGAGDVWKVGKQIMSNLPLRDK